MSRRFDGFLAVLFHRRRPVSAEPAPLGGGLVKAAWFKHYREHELPVRFDRIVQSWDAANKTTKLSDFSFCTTWGVRTRLRLFENYRRFCRDDLIFYTFCALAVDRLRQIQG